MEDTKMLEEMYDKLNNFRMVETRKKDVSALKQKEKEFNIIIPDPIYDFYKYFGNDSELLRAFYIFDEMEDIRIENDALTFGYTHQYGGRLGITLEKLNSRFKAISWYSSDSSMWFSEGSLFPESFFFNIAGWQILNTLPAVVRVRITLEDFNNLVADYFKYFSDNKIYIKGYKITTIYRENILGCYLREDEELYLAAKEDADLDRLEEILGLDFDWL